MQNERVLPRVVFQTVSTKYELSKIDTFSNLNHVSFCEIVKNYSVTSQYGSAIYSYVFQRKNIKDQGRLNFHVKS